MSSYLTGWDSEDNIGLQDIYNMESRYKTVAQAHRRNKSEEKVRLKKKTSNHKKFVIGQFKNRPKKCNAEFLKRDKPIITTNPHIKNISYKFLNKNNLLANNLRKKKQSMRTQICKNQFEQKTRSRKISTNVKVSVVNIFEKLDMRLPNPSRYQQAQKINGYLPLKFKQQKRSNSQTKTSQMIIGMKLQKQFGENDSKENVYRQLLSYGSSLHELSYINQNFIRKIHKSSSDYQSGCFQYKKSIR